MNYEIITDRFEIEKIAENMCIPSQGDEMHMYIDYNDLRMIRRISTLKYGISCKVCCSDNKFVETIASAIHSLDLPLSQLRSYLVNFRANKAEPTLSYEDLGNILNLVRDLGATETPNCQYEGIWSCNTNPSIPEGMCYINILFGVNKTEQDKQEDEKCEQMMKEYHKQLFPPLDFPVIDITPNDKE